MTHRSRGRFLGGLFLLLALLLAGCGGDDGARGGGPDREVAALQSQDRVRLETNVSTQYYVVRGTSADAIFDFIERYGPTDDKGQHASGLTASQRSYVWKSSSTRNACAIESMTITLSIAMTLPQHEQSGSLPPAVLTNWQGFAADVAAHEQHHVDIYMKDARSMQADMAAITPRPTCEELEREIGNVWSTHQRSTDAVQEAFHTAENARRDGERRPLQGQIDSNRARLATLTGQIRSLDATIQSLRSTIDELDGRVTPLNDEIARIDAAYPNAKPTVIGAHYQTLRQQRDALTLRRDSLVEEHNDAIDRRGGLANEYQQVQTALRNLVDAYNWTH